MVGKHRTANTLASNGGNYDQLTKEQLKAELKKHGLKVSGNKKELLLRLREFAAMFKNRDVRTSRTSDGGLFQKLCEWTGFSEKPIDPKYFVVCESRRLSNPQYALSLEKEEPGGVSKRRTESYSESNGGVSSANGKSSSSHPVSQSLKEQLKEERENLVLWKHPIVVLHYFIRETLCLISLVVQRMNTYRISVGLSLLLLLSLHSSTLVSGPHQAMVLWLEKRALWCLYWTGLGVLSSVGLGTGFHTFLLYLGPHIAKVSLAAYECGTLHFPEPPYPDEILCPDTQKTDWVPTLWSIMNKVKLEAMMWGAGTALGELPPYFISRAARQSLLDPEEVEDLVELEELHRKQKNPESMTFVDKLKLKIESLVNKVGFFGILACASIPNPLFDLAGITCGHFLIPFWTFFGATLIGKAVIKMSIQVIFVIVAFNETLINRVLAFLDLIPLVGSLLVEPVTNLWQRQKAKLRHNAPVDAGGSNILASLIEYLVTLLVLFFVISIVNAMAQAYHRRIHGAKVKK